MPAWPRAIRLRERWTITEKVDGTHALILIKPAGAEEPAAPGVTLTKAPDGRAVTVRAACRTRWLVPEQAAREGCGRDNFAFAAWVAEHAAELALLGPGAHHGEWYGAGIGHGYGLSERRFALLDTARWRQGLPDAVPDQLGLVPVLAACTGARLNATITKCLGRLEKDGSNLVAGTVAAGVIAYSDADPRFLIEAPRTETGEPTP